MGSKANDYDYLTLAEIALRFGMSKAATRSRLARAGLRSFALGTARNAEICYRTADVATVPPPRPARLSMIGVPSSVPRHGAWKGDERREEE